MKYFLEVLVNDRARAIPILSAFVVWLIVRTSGGLGFQLETAEQNALAFGIAIVIGYVIEALARTIAEKKVTVAEKKTEVLQEGVKQVQEVMQQVKPELKADGVPGPVMLETTQQVVSMAATTQP